MQGSSIDRQTKLAAEIAAQYNLEIVEQYSDYGVSAFHGQNSKTGALARFLELVGTEIPIGSWLFVENLDRISRADIIAAQELFIRIIRAGVTIVTGMDRKVYSLESVTNNPMDLMLSIMLFARAHEESQTKRNRTLASVQKKIVYHQNRKAGDPVWAIKELGNNFWWTDDTSGWLVPHEYYFPIIKEIVDLRRKGKSTRVITEYLNQRYVPPAKMKNGWSAAMIGRMFQTKALLGIKEINLDGQKYELRDYYPVLLSEAEYYALKDAMSRRALSHGKEKEKLFPILTGIGVLKCGYCGAGMIKIKGHTKAGEYRYSCGEGDKCPKGHWGFRGDILDREIVTRVMRTNLKVDNPLPALVSQLETLDAQVNRLVELAAVVGATPEISAKLTGLNAQRKEIQAEIEKISVEMYRPVHQDPILPYHVQSLLLKFDDSRRVKLKMLVGAALKRIECYRENGTVNLFKLVWKDKSESEFRIQRKGKEYIGIEK